MKKYTVVEERIYLVTIEYNHDQQRPSEVFEAFLRKFPEYEGCNYDYSLRFGQLSVLRIYAHSYFDFVEDED